MRQGRVGWHHSLARVSAREVPPAEPRPAPNQAANLYGFPALHALDPLSRVDLEISQAEIASRWPRALEARGTVVEVEAGDALILPQGVWHQVGSRWVVGGHRALVWSHSRSG